MENGFQIGTELPAPPRAVYEAWLSGPAHSAMTGGRATASAEVGGRFSAWDGYISGRNVSLKPHWCIVQAWRTTQFGPGDPDSRLELCIHPSGRGSKLVLIHTLIPPAQVPGYKSGWVEHYFVPMRKYFAAKYGTTAPAATNAVPTKRRAKKARKTVRNARKGTAKRPARKVRRRSRRR